MIALATLLDEACDRPEAPRPRRVLDGWVLAVAVADGTVVAGLALVDLVKVVVGLGDWAAALVPVAGVGR